MEKRSGVSVNRTFRGFYSASVLVFTVWFSVGLVVVGFGLSTPFGPFADLAFIAFASVVLLLHAKIFLSTKELVYVFLTFTFISGAAEAYGAATGNLFGSYGYSGNFGPLLFGLLPMSIPLAWWVVVWPLHFLMGSLVSGRRRMVLVPLGTAALAVWADLVIEPAATLVREYWTWNEGGVYYGVPWTNFLGWFATAFVLSFLALPVLPNSTTRRIPLLVPMGVLTATILTFFLLSLVHGKWLAVLVALGFFAAVFVLAGLSSRHMKDSSSSSEEG